MERTFDWQQISATRHRVVVTDVAQKQAEDLVNRLLYEAFCNRQREPIWGMSQMPEGTPGPAWRVPGSLPW